MAKLGFRSTYHHAVLKCRSLSLTASARTIAALSLDAIVILGTVYDRAPGALHKQHIGVMELEMGRLIFVKARSHLSNIKVY